MNRKLKLWGMSNQDTGVYYYRILQPLNFIARQKLARVHTLPFFGQHARHLVTDEFREYQALEGKWADVLYTTVGSDRDYLALILALKDRYKLKLVVDIDDDILSTHLEPSNPAHQAYLNPAGRHAEYTQACLREADLVTVSTEYLKKKYASINSNIAVIKNCTDPIFFSPKLYAEDPITIGFAGSGSHQADWKMIEPVIERLKTRHDIKVKMLGPLNAPSVDEQVRWVDMLKYPEELGRMGFSIGVAPLKDSLMNRAKSNLRWLEYSSFGIPTVASDVVPFRGIENALLVTEPEEWEEALEHLITSPDDRTRLGQAAYNEIQEHYDPSHWSRELYSHIERLFG